MRLLYVVHQFMPDVVGGTELDTWEIATRLRDRGHQVAIVHRAPGRGGLVRRTQEDVAIYRLEAGEMSPTRLFAATFGHRRLSQAFRLAHDEVAPDLVHVQHLRGLPTGIVAWMQSRGTPMVLTLHDFWFVCPNAQLIDNVTGEVCTTPGEPVHCARCALARAGLRPALFAAPLLAPLMRARNRILADALRGFDSILTYSAFVRRWFVEHGAPAARTRLINRGIARPEALPRSRRTDDGRVCLAYVGGLAWQKGLHVLIEAFNGLPTNAELIIAGDVEQDPDYVAHLRALARHPGIRFVGRLERPEVWQTLADADAVVVPSLWYETFSLLTREAFVMGRPVLASGHGVLADAVTHGVDGLLVPPGDVGAWHKALARFVASAALRVNLTAAVKPLPTMDVTIDELEAIYQRTLASRTRSSPRRPGLPL